MDYDTFKLHDPFSMLVAGPRDARKSELVKQLLPLKRYIMMNLQREFTLYKLYAVTFWNCLVLW